MRSFLPKALACVCAALLAAGTHGCGPAPPGAGRADEKVRLGVFIPLTGATAGYGLSSMNGFQMAAEEINSAGGVGGRQVELVVEDTRSDTLETERVVRRLVGERGVHALLGEVVSSRSLAAAHIAQAAGVAMLTPSSTNPAVTEVGDHVFRSCYTDPFQAAALARFASEGLRARRAAVLVDRSQSYSVELAGLFREAFARGGGQVVSEEPYAEGEEDFTQAVMQAGSAAPDVIFVPGYYREAGQIAKRARELGIDAPLVGGDGWDSPGLYHMGGEHLRGAFFSNHFSVDDKDAGVQTFVEDYIGLYGFPPDAFAATAYDAARILIHAVRDAGSLERRRIRDALAATRGFQGVTGTITIGPDRNAIKPVVIIRIEEGGRYAVQERLMPQGPSSPMKAVLASPTPAAPEETR